jgi:hypothetical protein
MGWMTRERWIGLAVACITVLLVLMAIALLERAEGKVAYDCFDATERERVREIALKGIDDGLQRAVVHLYDIWQRDPEQQQPKRAQVGVTNAINAHARARTFTLAWTPPACEKEK